MTRRNTNSRAFQGADGGYEIHEVSQLTGLAPARLRAWERRYAMIRPVRQANGYRAYSGEQVALLRAYARLVGAGERIGDLARRPVHEVLAWAEARELDDTPHGALLEAVIALDRDRLEALVAQQASLRGVGGFAREVALPLGREVGDLWALGRLTLASRHLADEVVVHTLKAGLRMARESGPTCMAACLPGDHREWEALCWLLEVREAGWEVNYLGLGLSPDDLVEAAWQRPPGAVAVCASDPGMVEMVLPELLRLPGRLPPGTMAVIGGGGMEPYHRSLVEEGFQVGLDAFDAGRGEAVG